MWKKRNKKKKDNEKKETKEHDKWKPINRHTEKPQNPKKYDNKIRGKKKRKRTKKTQELKNRKRQTRKNKKARRSKKHQKENKTKKKKWAFACSANFSDSLISVLLPAEALERIDVTGSATLASPSPQRSVDWKIAWSIARSSPCTSGILQKCLDLKKDITLIYFCRLQKHLFCLFVFGSPKHLATCHLFLDAAFS